ncbi:hypothetical protein B2M27_22515 [Kluyvera intermedia]|uniref:Fimbrial-type adhesion domain-containing protein n=1 Tax=Kluyvera intermedia TaxID=61648 RepID=A0ABX3UAL8_KLUIN|nr:fimbrial protein [Kluyvera intermedia]ORJ48107.1 hypothetical protein B2M27_22515 [Kluyvera intermedia]
MLFKLILLSLLLAANVALANTVSCTPNSGLAERSITVPLGVIKTTPSEGSYNQPLYTFSAYFMGNIKLDCNSSDGFATPASRTAFITSSSGGLPALEMSALYPQYIYSTSAAGIGVSFSYHAGNTGLSTKNNPAILNASFDSNGDYSWADRLDITVWKLGSFPVNARSDNSYMINDTFQFVHAMTLLNSNSTFSTVPFPEVGVFNSWVINRVNITFSGAMEIVRGTCNIQNKTVWMGHHPLNAVSQSSPWKDASFTVNCNTAWGLDQIDNYSDSHTYINTVSRVNNWGYIVTVLPRTNVIDNTNGIIALKSGGAQGYGLQLAWGKPASQTSAGQPANPVLFNSQIFGAFIPDIGFPEFEHGATPQQEFNMSARYVRLPGEAVQPGDANASVEVVVTYL